MKKAVGYLRVSTDIQLDGYSIPKQDREVRRHCEYANFELLKIYNEGSGSGSSIKERPEFRQLLHDVLSNEKESIYIVVWKLDRFARNLKEAMCLLDEIHKKGHYLVSISEGINTETEGSILLLQVLFAMAENERRNILFHCKNGMKERAEKGLFNGGRVFGYSSTPAKKLQINEHEAKIVRFIFDRYVVDGWGYKKIASYLNNHYTSDEGNSRSWSIFSIKSIVTNPIYAGFIRWGEKGKERKIYKGQHHAIISEEQWFKAQNSYSERSYQPVKIHKGSYFLSGFLKCPECNSSMVQHKSSGGKYLYYQCSQNKNKGLCKANLINKNDAEQKVLTELSSKLKATEIRMFLSSKLSSQLKLDIQPKYEQFKFFKKRLKELQTNKKQLFDLYYKQIIDEDALSDQLSHLQSSEKDINDKLKRVESSIELENNLNVGLIVNNILDNFEQFFQSLDDIKKKELLKEIIQDIQVTTVPLGKKRVKRVVNQINYHFEIYSISKLVS